MQRDEAYSDEGSYVKDGGEDGALYDEEEPDAGDYRYEDQGEDEYRYEDEEEMPFEEEEEMYPLDGTLSEDQEPPYTPTPTSAAPTLTPADSLAPSSRPPLEKQASLLHDQPPQAQQSPFQPPISQSQTPPLEPYQDAFAKAPVSSMSASLQPPEAEALPFAPASSLPLEPAGKPSPMDELLAMDEPLPSSEIPPTVPPEETGAPPESTEAPPDR